MRDPKNIPYLEEHKISGIEVFQCNICVLINGIAQVIDIVISWNGDRKDYVLAFDEIAKFEINGLVRHVAEQCWRRR
jgi:hypothetical protein